MSDRTELRRPQFPFRLNLEQQRKRAKDLRRALAAGEPAAWDRLRRHLPKGTAAEQVGLADAQLVVAREVGLASWARLKAHVLAMESALGRISAKDHAPDREMATLHIRCGSDIHETLQEAGFVGAFLEYSDALCQGPVVEAADWLERRARYLADAYGGVTGQDFAQTFEKLAAAEARLRSAAERFERVVLWFEHDSYDQLNLARCLAAFSTAAPRRLEMVSVDRFPGSARFIGLGQLPPEALRLLWDERRLVAGAQLDAGRRVWEALRRPDPLGLVAVAGREDLALPYMAAAVRRHCQELPWVGDGLGLTERLVLRLVAERSRTVGEVFRDLMVAQEPLPWLGNVMLWFIVESMKKVDQPVFSAAFDGDDHHWPRERLAITQAGLDVLSGSLDYLSLSPPERWLGGVCISSGWRWNEEKRIAQRG